MEKNIQQQINELGERVTELEYLIRIGTVTSVNSEKRTVRVSWANGMRSADLRCLTLRRWANTEGDAVNWLPSVGDKAVSIHRPRGQGDGYILGVL